MFPYLLFLRQRQKFEKKTKQLHMMVDGGQGGEYLLQHVCEVWGAERATCNLRDTKPLQRGSSD